MSYNVVDSSGWIEYFRGGENLAFFEPVILDTASLIVPTITIVEVARHMTRWRSENDVAYAVARMRQGVVIELDFFLAVAAGRLGIELKLPLADSIILVMAHARDATLWTQDTDFESMPGVQFVRRQ